MSDLLRSRVQAIQKLAEAATEGPWHWVDYETDAPVAPGGESQVFRVSLRTVAEHETPSVGPLPHFILSEVQYEQETSNDARFIAAARTEVPWLCAALLEALDTIDKARALHVRAIAAKVCRECGDSWPCPTWQALNPQNGES